MSITKERVEELVKEFGGDDKDTGSPEVQIAIITDKIRNITEHLKLNKKDHSGRRGLILLVSQRRRLLSYVKKSGPGRYKTIIDKLNIRK
jgi:small subunit ribosomal protein S15